MTQARDVFVTRLHLRYDSEHFPDDLRFHQTADRTNFQGRYVIRHAWDGSPRACPAARDYFDRLARRQRGEAETLARLTGWDLAEIHRRMRLEPLSAEADDKRSWWQRLWDG